VLEKLYCVKVAASRKVFYGSTHLVDLLLFGSKSTFQTLNQTQSKTYGHTRIDGKTYGHTKISGKGTKRLGM
jgi:hypothetical protein